MKNILSKKKIFFLLTWSYWIPLQVLSHNSLPLPGLFQHNELVPSNAINIIDNYKPATVKLYDLIHTKLEIKVDWDHQQLHGIAVLQVKPHFYSQNKLMLDANNLLIHEVNLLKGTEKVNLMYTYQRRALTLSLDHFYTKEDTIEVEIHYSTKPHKGKFRMGEDQGAFFINAHVKDKYKPQQLWTQGEPNTSSCWFPTLDSPNQRSTQELYITIDDKFKTLSNGMLIYTILNKDNTRTDYWRLDMPHPPYLFMLAVGEFEIIQEEWNDLPVAYYLESNYAQATKKVFENTPEMLSFFSEKLDYPFPWPSYNQIVVRDYLAGAMENTTAVVLSETFQGDERTLLDKLDQEEVIAHELFHHWFGNLVTCEAWSQLVLNEAFATWGSHLWYKYKYGSFEAGRLLVKNVEKYLQEAKNKKKSLIRDYYQNPLEVFDNHTYQKGFLVLHLLYNYLGEEAFLQALSLYLKRHAFTTTDLHQLRKCFEEVAGQDLNWFFNQWFFEAGHPLLHLQHTYAKGKLLVKIWQKQIPSTPIYKLPMVINLWLDDKKIDCPILLDKTYQEFSFPVAKNPKAISLDKNYFLVGEIEQVQSISAWQHIYRYTGGDFLMQSEAIQAIKMLKKDCTNYYNFFCELLSESTYWKFQIEALEAFKAYRGGEKNCPSMAFVEKRIGHLINSPHSMVREKVIETLRTWPPTKFHYIIYEKCLVDPSYQVAAAALEAYLSRPLRSAVDKKEAILLDFEQYDHPAIIIKLATYYITTKKVGKYAWFKEKTEKLCTKLGGESLISLLVTYTTQLGNEQQKATTLALIEAVITYNHSSLLLSTAQKALETMIPTKEVTTLLRILKK